MIAAVLLLSSSNPREHSDAGGKSRRLASPLQHGRTLAGCARRLDTGPHCPLGRGGRTIKKVATGNVPRVADGRPLVGGDLMTVDSFADFELSFEWKVTPGANSGRQ